MTEHDFSAEFRGRPGHLVNRASRLFLRYGDLRMQPLGVGTAAVPVLVLLKEGVEMTQRDLAACTRLEQPSMAQLLSRLERDGMIRRRPDPDDGRASLISLSEKAQALLPEVNAIAQAGNDAAMAGFTKEEVQQLLDYLRRVIVNLEAESGNASQSESGLSGSPRP